MKVFGWLPYSHQEDIYLIYINLGGTTTYCSSQFLWDEFFYCKNNINFIGGINMIKVTLKDGSVKEFENELSVLEIAKSIS